MKCTCFNLKWERIVIYNVSGASQALATTGHTGADSGLSLHHRDVQCVRHSSRTALYSSGVPRGGLGTLSLLCRNTQRHWGEASPFEMHRNLPFCLQRLSPTCSHPCLIPAEFGCVSPVKIPLQVPCFLGMNWLYSGNLQWKRAWEVIAVIRTMWLLSPCSFHYALLPPKDSASSPLMMLADGSPSMGAPGPGYWEGCFIHQLWEQGRSFFGREALSLPHPFQPLHSPHTAPEGGLWAKSSCTEVFLQLRCGVTCPSKDWPMSLDGFVAQPTAGGPLLFGIPSCSENSLQRTINHRREKRGSGPSCSEAGI